VFANETEESSVLTPSATACSACCSASFTFFKLRTKNRARRWFCHHFAITSATAVGSSPASLVTAASAIDAIAWTGPTIVCGNAFQLRRRPLAVGRGRFCAPR
jgi:hypothetical protein